ncbi:MAG: methionine--tRNA ligase [Candidatus Aenigmatarchaeota archaeon]
MSDNEKVLITSALPYIHGIPHLGNIIGSVLPADVYYRFQRLKGKEVIYICGSDSHGTMYEIEAEKQNKETEELVYENHKRIMDLFQRMNLDFSYYGITDSEENREITSHIFEKLDENGYIKEREIELPYCKNCEKFLADRWIEGECPECGGLARGDQCDDCNVLLEPKDIIEPYCVHCEEKEIEFRKSSHLFFQLQEFEDWLKEWIEGRTGNKLTRSETLSWLNQGLEERCITRDSSWGFSVPKEGYEDKVLYVWFDAPIGYIGTTMNWAEEKDENWEDWWYDDVKMVQFMGKDNIPFHTVIFPSVLKGTEEDWNYADKVMASAWLMSKDVKFSKSRGKGLNLESALEIRDSEYWRYVLMALYPENDDTTFSWDVFQNKVNNELVDSFGNYIHRVLKFIYDRCDGEIPDDHPRKGDLDFLRKLEERMNSVERNMEEFKFRRAINDIIKVSSMGNQYFQKKEPWETIKEDEEACKRTLFVCANIVKSLAILIEPFLPETAEEIWNYLNQDSNIHEEDWERAKKFDLGGVKIKEPEPLFEKIEKDELPDFKDDEEQEKNGGEDDMISFDQFQNLDLRIGEIKKVEEIEGADKLVKLQIDLGDETKQSVAGVKKFYDAEDLVGRKVPVLANLEPAELMGEKSECMILAADVDGEPILFNPDKEVSPGTKIR